MRLDKEAFAGPGRRKKKSSSSLINLVPRLDGTGRADRRREPAAGAPGGKTPLRRVLAGAAVEGLAAGRPWKVST